MTKWIVLGVVALILLVWGLISLISSGFVGVIIAIAILWALGLALKILVERFGVTWFVVWLARQDVWWSPFRMKAPPGTIIMMARGIKPGGPFAMVLPADIPYWHYHDRDERFYYEGDTEKEKGIFKAKFPKDPPRPEDKLPKFLRDIGVVWVGFFRRYYRRHRRWDVLDNSKSKKDIIVKETKVEEEHIFYFSTTMAIDLETIPTKEGYPAQMKLAFNVLLIHPRRAEFLAGKSETRVDVAVRKRCREYIGGKSVKELRVERDDEGDQLVDSVLRANYKQKKETGTVGLLPAFGVMIDAPEYFDFDLESGDKEMTDAMKRQMIASEDVKTAGIRKQETIAIAEAEKEKRRIEGEGRREARKAEAEGIKTEFAARMSVPQGAELSWAEAVKSAAPKFLSLGRDGKGGIMVGVNEADSD